MALITTKFQCFFLKLPSPVVPVPFPIPVRADSRYSRENFVESYARAARLRLAGLRSAIRFGREDDRETDDRNEGCGGDPSYWNRVGFARKPTEFR